MTAYYNEFDREKAAWLRELIRQDLVAPGDVDERSILEVRPDDLRGYTQAHFFAGIGVWSHALRRAGWPDDRPVWTGSCPCQDLSAAGKKAGFDGERHLWPDWFRLIRECRPGVVFGEQVASPLGLAWLDLVHADLEGAAYTVGAVDTCSAGFGAPHIRQRLYWVAHPGSERRQQVDRGSSGDETADGRESDCDHLAAGCGATGELADAADGDGRAGKRGEEAGARPDGERRRGSAGGGAAGRVALANGERGCGWPAGGEDAGDARLTGEAGPVNGFWRNAEWLPCTDGKARPAEPGTFPLAYGAPFTVDLLRGYGDAIVAPQAAEFIGAYIEEMKQQSLQCHSEKT